MRVFGMGMSDPDGNLLWLFGLPGSGAPDPGIYSGCLCKPVRSFTNGPFRPSPANRARLARSSGTREAAVPRRNSAIIAIIGR